MYAYDGLYQLTNRKRGEYETSTNSIASPVREEGFTYDPIGNWENYKVYLNADPTPSLNQDRSHNTLNELTKIDGSCDLLTTEPYDAAGNMKISPPPEDGDWDKAYKLKWDAWNRLIEVRKEEDDALIAKYAYDGLYRRTTKDADGTVTHYYYNLQWKVVEESV